MDNLNDIGFVSGIITLCLMIAPLFIKRITKRKKAGIALGVFVIAFMFWSGMFYYKLFVESECIMTYACAESQVLSHTKDEDPNVWKRLSEEILIRGKWDTSGFEPINNSLCTQNTTDLYKLMWRNESISLLTKRIKLKFYILDLREKKDAPLFFIVAFRTKDPETGRYELPISSFSLPVDGKTDRIEFKELSDGKLIFVDNPGNLQNPIQEKTQIELEYTTSSAGNYLSQYYEVLFNPIGDNDTYIPSNLKPFTLNSLPFSSFDGALVQVGFGITSGGCIQNLEYYVDQHTI